MTGLSILKKELISIMREEMRLLVELKAIKQRKDIVRTQVHNEFQKNRTLRNSLDVK